MNGAGIVNVYCELVVMLLFFVQYSRDGDVGTGIIATDRLELVLQMSKHDPLDRYGCGGDAPSAHQASEEAEYISSDTAQPIAAASRQSSSFQFVGKDGSMPLLMRFEFGQFMHQGTRSQPCHCDLPSVYIHGSMLTCMVHLDDPSRIND
jgi:hypothetical protein